jgi:hypothetical protein
MAGQVTENSLIIVGSSARHEWTVKQFAKAEQVDPKTVRRWIAKGALHVRRTPGGHFRISGSR